ncbi:TonB-dependent siderophore receptor [Photobacterium sagamiensis]|uniref:TonB-dependent siderophore receptor n=1 Tax=Photobacterium sagamiensis TaxID=2910241 RepID=UPI003D128A0F
MFRNSQLTLLIGAVLTAPVVQAQATDVDEHMVITGRDYGYKVDTNTSAMRIEATQLETPGQVTVIDEQLIDEQRASTLGEVLKNDASVSAGGTSTNRERFSLRGFELQSSSGYLRDGNPHWSHYRQPIELLERVEVLKGPAGLLYGKSAPGGLVNMVSKKPTYETQVNVSQDIDSNNYTRSMVDVSGALNDDQTLRARAILSSEQQDSWRTRFDGSDVETERFVGGLFIDYDVNDNVTVSAHYDITDELGDLDNGSKVDPITFEVIDPNVVNDQHWAETDNNVENYGVSVVAQFSDAWSVKSGINRQYYERRRTESDIHLDSKSYEDTQGNKHTDYYYGASDRHDEWTFDTAFVDVAGDVDAFGANHRLLAGVNGLHYDYKRLYSSTKSCKFTDDKDAALNSHCAGGFNKPTDLHYKNDDAVSHSESQHYGLYLQDLVTINDDWQALAGVRFAYDKTKDSAGVEESYNNILPKFGLIYHPASNGSIYAMYSESFEPVETISDEEDENFGEEQDPMKGYLYELGTKWELLDNQLYVSGAIFQITQENIQITEDVTSSTTRTTQAGEQVHRGAEFNATGYLTDAFSLSASMTYLDAEISDPSNASVDGNRPADVAEFAASVWTRYSFANNTDVNLGAIYVGDRFGDEKNTYKKDAYTRVDSGVAHTIKYDTNLDVVMRLNVENVFDTEYLGGGSTRSVVVGEGRNYKATLQFRY